MEGLRFRNILAIGGIILAIIWVVPSFVDVSNKWWPSKSKINYGLDIQGGLHLVMGVDVDGVVGESVQRMIESTSSELAKEGVAVTEVKSSQPAQGQIEFHFASSQATQDKIEKFLADKYGTVLQQMSSSETMVSARYFDAYMNDYKSRVIQQAIETIRNRIDEFGVAEPSISQQGANRILVQLPGMADAERAKELINTTAKLDFMIVSHEKTPQELQALISDAEKAGNYSMATLKYSEYVQRLNNDLKPKLPPQTVVYFEKSANALKMEAGAVPYLLKTDTNLNGSALNDATVSFGQYGEPQVGLNFNTAGSAKFADLTGANSGKQMAIVLDRVVKSAPNIRERIAGGSAVITLGNSRDHDASMNEAKMISTALRAGALPASLEQLEERRVGPSLGADSIDSAKMASVIGAVLIILFTLVYYKGMGVISVVSLAINILSMFALLASFGATLTLPGIAAISLTVAFAIDANVLINERIRDELKLGHSMRVAIQEGYRHAMSAILDANITTAATAVVLLYFGTGPVRGFAVNLIIGVLTTLFANVFVSKVIVDNLMVKFGVKKISV